MTIIIWAMYKFKCLTENRTQDSEVLNQSSNILTTESYNIHVKIIHIIYKPLLHGPYMMIVMYGICMIFSSMHVLIM